ncbi:hypothetical protein BURKHO8Y_10388 [Burkholderia sp. 8Y]|nr:hypothetical protein BURKHO8Y_10388 [Burkholderia sp. 8Y]
MSIVYLKRPLHKSYCLLKQVRQPFRLLIFLLLDKH